MVATADFRSLEDDLETFEIEVDSVPVWERIRFDLFRTIQEQNGIGQAHTVLESDLRDQLRGLKLWFLNLVRRNPLLAPKSDFLFVGHQRRKHLEDGYWWDLYTDLIHEQGALDSVQFESPHLLNHHTPAKTDSIRYLELLTFGGNIQMKFGMHSVSIPEKTRKRLRKIETVIDNRFGADVDVLGRVQETLRERRSRLWLYKLLLKRVDPKLVVLVVSYYKETFIEACQDLGIPVVELQHGVIHEEHLGYSFPGDRTKTTFPDYLLTWGEFWGEGMEFPIPKDRVIPVGYPYLDEFVDDYAAEPSRDRIVFISQGTIGGDLSKFAIEVADHSDIDHDIVYKLHPGEYDRWQDEYPWLVDADFEVIDSSEPPLYKLLAESSVQIGVYSTAIFEGLAFDLETYIYDCAGAETLQSLIAEGAAGLVSSADELASAMETQTNSFDADYYFSPDATDRVLDTLDRLSEDGTIYSNNYTT